MVAPPWPVVRLVAEGNGDKCGKVMYADDYAHESQIQAEFNLHHPVENAQSEYREHSGRELSQAQTQNLG